jgi:hypothetical protein
MVLKEDSGTVFAFNTERMKWLQYLDRDSQLPFYVVTLQELDLSCRLEMIMLLMDG